MNSLKKFSASDILLQALGLAFVVFLIIALYQNNFSAAISKEIKIENKFPNEEQTFTKPIKITWQGKVIANLEGGEAYGIKMVSQNKSNPAFYACCGTENNLWLDGKVRITGNWIGITCAYQNTIFSGRCVPEVEIEEIEKL